METAIDFDPYQILGVGQNADKSAINDSYRKLAIQCHPDKFTDPTTKNTKEKEFQQLLLAYDVLIDDNRRRQYNTSLEIKREGRAEPSKKKKQRPSGMLAAEGFIQGRLIAAMPDTGAGFNLISASLVASLGFSKPPVNIRKGVDIRMANGKLIRTVGALEVSWSFLSEMGVKWNLMFHILEDFVYDLVLGSDFLRHTQTMSAHQYRLSRIPTPLHALSVLYVNSLGCVSQRLQGSLDGSLVEALPDSGSESSLLSLEYVQNCGWMNKIDNRDSRLLLFADGTVERTMGTLTLQWRYRNELLGSDTSATVLDFHILYGCAYDAILGQDLLEDTDAFVQHQSSFVDSAVENGVSTEPSELNLVIWLPLGRFRLKRTRQDSEGTSSGGPSNDIVGPELKRRAAAHQTIMRMTDGEEKNAAEAEEEELRKRFDGISEQPSAEGIGIIGTDTSTEDSSASEFYSNLTEQVRRANFGLPATGIWRDEEGLSMGASVAPWAVS